MALADRLAAGPVIKVKHYCGVTLILRDLDETEAAALESMLNDAAWAGADIARALNDEGHKISGSSVQRHRRGECACRSLTA